MEKVVDSSPQEFVRDNQGEEYHRETHCPSCGRFIGVYERCPYCQTLTRKRISVRVFKVISLLTSTVGLVLLLFYAQRVQTPEVNISDLGPLSNFAHVRVVGEVEKSYGIHPEWQSLGFVLRQPGKNNSIRVSAYSKVAKEIQEKNLIPQEGARVSVEGQVRFQKDSPSLLINTSEHLKIIKPADIWTGAVRVKPEQITQEHVGKKVLVEGTIEKLVNFPKGTIVRLSEGKQGFPVWISAALMQDSGFDGGPGDVYEFLGKVKPFREALEVEVYDAKGIRALRQSPTEKPVVTPAPAPTAVQEGTE
jgi:DNA/RNA endonuclease YhcR with UshA esterase domain